MNTYDLMMWMMRRWSRWVRLIHRTIAHLNLLVRRAGCRSVVVIARAHHRIHHHHSLRSTAGVVVVVRVEAVVAGRLARQVCAGHGLTGGRVRARFRRFVGHCD